MSLGHCENSSASVRIVHFGRFWVSCSVVCAVYVSISVRLFSRAARWVSRTSGREKEEKWKKEKKGQRQKKGENGNMENRKKRTKKQENCKNTVKTKENEGGTKVKTQKEEGRETGKKTCSGLAGLRVRCGRFSISTSKDM